MSFGVLQFGVRKKAVICLSVDKAEKRLVKKRHEAQQFDFLCQLYAGRSGITMGNKRGGVQ